MNENRWWSANAVREFQWGNITPGGVVYADELNSAAGVDILLIKQSDQKMEDLEEAASWLRDNRDVICIEWQDMDPEEEQKLKALQKALEKERSTIRILQTKEAR